MQISTVRHFEIVIFRFRRPKWVPAVRLQRDLNPHLTFDEIDFWKQTARNLDSRIGSYTRIREFQNLGTSKL